MDRERYHTTEEAAGFVGYSVRQFRRLVEKHNIPAYGPGLNRFKLVDLDTFMENPQAFTLSRIPRRCGGGFKQVQL